MPRSFPDRLTCGGIVKPMSGKSALSTDGPLESIQQVSCRVVPANYALHLCFATVDRSDRLPRLRPAEFASKELLHSPVLWIFMSTDRRPVYRPSDGPSGLSCHIH